MKNKKRAMRKFKKKSIILPILAFVLGVVFMFCAVGVIFVLEIEDITDRKMTFAKEACNLKAEQFVESLSRYDDDIEKALENSSYEIVIAKDGKTLYSNTKFRIEDTVSVSSGDGAVFYYSKDDLYGMFGTNIDVSDFDTEELKEIIPLLETEVKENVLNEMSKGVLYSLNAWVLTDVSYEEGLILVHSPIQITYSDIKTGAILLISVFVLFVAVAAVLFFNIFSSARSNNKMLKALYFDDKTLTNNWLYLTTGAEKMLRKQSGTYAVISVKCCKYNHCKSCAGVAAADKILFETYNEIKKLLRKNDYIARESEAYIGIVLRRQTAEEIKAMVDIIDKNTREKVYSGVYIFESDKKIRKKTVQAEGIEDFYHYAKLACRSINESDDDGIAYFDDKLKEENRWINTVETRLDEALEKEEFVVYIQPKYDPKDSELKGAEALIRWISPENGILAPGRFIPICEENGSIVKIDDYMIAHIAKLQSEWIEKGYKVVPVSVNVSRVHFMDSNLAEHICELVDRYNAPHDSIEIELTESAFFDDKNVLLGTVEKLQNLGFQVSMDDFGSGYSSLNSLKDLSIDVLKLDADFFRGEGQEERGELIVSKAIELAKALDMEIVAEGVEQQEQVDFLAGAGCDMIQGFYYSKPMPAEEFEKCMKKEENEDISEEKAQNEEIISEEKKEEIISEEKKEEIISEEKVDGEEETFSEEIIENEEEISSETTEEKHSENPEK